MTRILSRAFSAIILLALIVSCGDIDEPTFDSIIDEDETFGIRGDLTLRDYEQIGNNAPPFNTSEYPDFSSVVSFAYSLDGSDEFDYSASGVLISPEWILTAGHNFFVSDDQNSPAPVSGIVVVLGNDPNDFSKEVEIESLTFFPTWLEDDAVYGNANDLCLVKLKSPINSITPAKLLKEPSEQIGSITWAAGFGDYSQQPGQDPEAYSLRHATSNTLDRAASGISSTSSSGTFTGGLLAFDFDSPSGTINSLGDDYISDDEPLLGTGTSSPIPVTYEGSAVEGDSGGPLFLQIGNEWLVAGILSGSIGEPFIGHQPNSYGEIDVFIRVSLAYDWIQDVTGL